MNYTLNIVSFIIVIMCIFLIFLSKVGKYSGTLKEQWSKAIKDPAYWVMWLLLVVEIGLATGL